MLVCGRSLANAVPAARQHSVGSCHSRIKHIAMPKRIAAVPCSVSQQLLQLETAVLADMPTEQVIQLLQKHGVEVQMSANDQQIEQQQRQQKQPQQPTSQSLSKLQKQQQHQQRQQQQQKPHTPHNPQLDRHLADRSRRVAAAAAKRSQLLKQLAAARVAARAKIVRLPLRLTIAGRAGSRRYLTVPVDVDGVGFVDFLLDSSSFNTRIVPAFRNKLGIGPADGVPVVLGQPNKAQPPTAAAVSAAAASGGSSNAAAGGTVRLRMRQRVQLPQMWLGTSQLPQQQAYVSPLPLLPTRRQPSSSNNSTSSSSSTPGGLGSALLSASSVAGSLGVQVLRSFELDVDVAGNLLAIHPAGHVELGLCDVTGTTAVPCRYTKGGAIVLPVSLAGSPPFTGLLDLSAASSVMNWEAAALLGMTCTERQAEQLGQQQGEPNHSASDSAEQNSKNGAAKSDRDNAASMYGYFGSVVVVPDDLLQRPRLPASKIDGVFDTRHHQVPAQDSLKLKVQHPGQAADDSSGKTAESLPSSRSRMMNNPVRRSHDIDKGIYTPLRVQQHRVASSHIKLVLGARLPASLGDSNRSSTGSVAVAPPSRIGVAALKGLNVLGIAGQPAMVIGADIWAKSRAVLCLKAGRMYLQT